MEQANAIIYITDVMEGINPVDKRLASWLRRMYNGMADRVVLVVNKVDNDDRADSVEQFIRLGLGEPVSCSASHSSGLSEVFYKALMKMIKYQDQPIAMAIEEAKLTRQKQQNNVEDTAEILEEEKVEENDEEHDDYQIPWEFLMGANKGDEIDGTSKIATTATDLSLYRNIVKQRDSEAEKTAKSELEELEAREPVVEQKTLKLAILGRPNVGKSSTLNAIVGKNRAIVSNIAGTTHDPIDEKIRWRDETDILLVDTAGIRRRGHHKIGIESLTILWAMQIIERSEVVLLVVDAKEGILRQDKRLATEILERNRSVIVVVNKWDGKVKRSNKVTTIVPFRNSFSVHLINQ